MARPLYNLGISIASFTHKAKLKLSQMLALNLSDLKKHSTFCLIVLQIQKKKLTLPALWIFYQNWMLRHSCYRSPILRNQLGKLYTVITANIPFKTQSPQMNLKALIFTFFLLCYIFSWISEALYLLGSRTNRWAVAKSTLS